MGVEGRLEVDAGLVGQQPESQIGHQPASKVPDLRWLLAVQSQCHTRDCDLRL